MPSVFAFYRPRGIAGTYVVGIQLDLRPTETARVSVEGEYHRFGYTPFEKVEKETEDGTRQLYRIEKLLVGDRITIHIDDTELVPFQHTVYTATYEGFQITSEPCTIWHHGFSMNFGIVVLNDIRVIDLDTEDVVIQQEERVVDALPAQPEPAKQQRVYKPRQKRTLQPHGNHPAIIPDIDDTPFSF